MTSYWHNILLTCLLFFLSTLPFLINVVWCPPPLQASLPLPFCFVCCFCPPGFIFSLQLFCGLYFCPLWYMLLFPPLLLLHVTFSGKLTPLYSPSLLYIEWCVALESTGLASCDLVETWRRCFCRKKIQWNWSVNVGLDMSLITQFGNYNLNFEWLIE